MTEERRSNIAPELRAESVDGEAPRITGYAAVFNELSADLGGFREKIRPGAFKETIAADDIRALWNHDPNFVLGRTTNGTLKLEEDQRGLRIDIKPPDTQWARDAMTTIGRGDVDQMSFGFETRDDRWTQAEGETQRELISVGLFDVSPVTYSAYPQTSAEARSMAKNLSAPDPDLAIYGKSDPDAQAGILEAPTLTAAQVRDIRRRWRMQLAEQEVKK